MSSIAASVHAGALVIDTHADTPQRFLDDQWDFTSPDGGGMISLHSARGGNLAAEFFAIWVEPTEHAGRFLSRALSLTDAVLEQVRRHPEELALCLSPADILTAHSQGKFGVLLGLEGGHAIANSLANLRTFHRLGIRYMTLTWSNSNEWADSSGDIAKPSVAHHNGLTAFGREVIAEMNRLGMMVDVSHVSDKTFQDVLDTSSAPVIASHSSARAITDSPRNLTDQQLRALAERNGVAMVNFFPAFIDSAWNQSWEACRDERRAMHQAAAQPFRDAGLPVPFAVADQVDRIFTARIPRAPFASLITHFDHMIQVAGIDHVGIGTDFDGIPDLPAGIDSAGDLPLITEALIKLNYTAEDLKKVLGGNVLRVFEEVQAGSNRR
jgi:membrane dipeptidase